MIREEDIKNIFFPMKLEISEKFIKNNKWCSIVIWDGPWLMDYEWLSKAFTYNGDENIYYVTISQNAKDNIFVEYRKQTKYLIKDFLYKNSGIYSLFLSKNNNGLLYQADEYCIVAGNKKFMEIAHPISFETSKELYFENLTDIREEYRINSEYIWNKYAVDNCS